MRQDATTTTPREPEIEFLGRIVRIALRGIRVVLWLAGVAGVVVCVQRMVVEGQLAPSAVWLCPGLLLITPIAWHRGRRLGILLAIGALLWFGPIALPDDTSWGFVLRMFATLIAFLTLFVWHTLWRLTEAPAADPGVAADDPPADHGPPARDRPVP